MEKQVFELNQQSIRQYVSTTYFQRGLQYFRYGRVKNVDIVDNLIAGVVQGSGSHFYNVILSIELNGTLQSVCTCPLSSACKHVVALGLAALEKFSGSIQQTLVFSYTDTEKKDTPQTPSWKQQLTPFLQEITDTRQQQKTGAHLRLLLQLERNYVRIPGTQKKQVTLQLKFRPQVFYPKMQKISLTDFSWSDTRMSYSVERLRLPQEEVDFFRFLLSALHMNEWMNQRWINVSEEQQHAAACWKVLRQSADFGVQIVSGKHGEHPVPVSSEEIQCALNIDDEKEDITIHSTFLLQEQEILKDHIYTIGKKMSYALVSNESLYTPGKNLNQVSLRFHPIRNLAIHRPFFITQPLTIPKADIADFEKTIAPKLLPHLHVNNRSKRIVLPKQANCQGMAIVIFPEKGATQSIRVQPTFSYENEAKQISITHTAPLFHVHKQAYMRNREQEQAFFQQLMQQSTLDGKELLSTEQASTMLQGIIAARFMHELVPQLQQQPWVNVEIDPHVQAYTFADEQPQVELCITEQTDNTDWFDLSVTVRIDDESIPFYTIFEAIVQKQKYLLLKNGKYIALNHPQFQQLQKLLEEAQHIRDKKKGDSISISRYQVGLWQELQQLGIVKEQTERWQKTVTGLTSPRVQRFTTPKQCKATLRSYQQEGYSWLRFLYQNELGGILADDMGLGKTIQAIALMIAKQHSSSDPFLVIAPTSVVENWDMELERFAPKLKKVIFRRGDRSEHFETLRQSSVDVVVTSYALLLRDREEFLQRTFDTIIVDEAQYVKNYQSKIYATIRQLKSKRRLALTGTPMENSLIELWSISSLVAPGLFPSPQEFREQYQLPIERHNNKEKLQQLQRRIRPFLMRRTKEVVAKELPKKTEQTMMIDLHPKHRKLYDVHLQKERKKVLQLLGEEGGMQKNRFAILQSLTHLRQLALHPALVIDNKTAQNAPSAKLETLVETIQTVTAENHRVLVFSQFTSFLALVRSGFDTHKIPYLYLDGKTKNRKELVQEFQTSQTAPQVFLISLKAGGVGLNLTAADYCMVLDPWWNPAVEQQAVDRAHRIGQTKRVMVYKCIAKDTIEEKVLALQEKKKQLFHSVLDSTAQFSSLLSEKDIRNLLS
ncbi:MAG TPA: SNF2-related protein [Patescibacteria group bacterium]|nr:SNF2-related protein [Patescibacteria group bacterium]